MLYLLFSGTGRVSVFTVHEPPEPGGTRFERAERLLFLRDGFSWRAALFSPFYLLLRGEWLALAAYAVAAVALAVALRFAGAGNEWGALAFVLLNVLTGFELGALKRWSLARRGWREIAAVSGRGQNDAERRFFDAWLPSLPAEMPVYAAASGSATYDHPAAGLEAALRRLSARLRSKFAVKT